MSISSTMQTYSLRKTVNGPDCTEHEGFKATEAFLGHSNPPDFRREDPEVSLLESPVLKRVACDT